MPISQDHPLRRLFRELVTRHFHDDPSIAEYVCGLLIDFVHIDRLYRIRDSRGKRLEEVGEMLIESNPTLEARSFDREREVRKHIGDYTLFLSGLFPEYVASLPRRGLRLDSLVLAEAEWLTVWRAGSLKFYVHEGKAQPPEGVLLWQTVHVGRLVRLIDRAVERLRKG